MGFFTLCLGKQSSVTVVQETFSDMYEKTGKKVSSNFLFFSPFADIRIPTLMLQLVIFSIIQSTE